MSKTIKDYVGIYHQRNKYHPEVVAERCRHSTHCDRVGIFQCSRGGVHKIGGLKFCKPHYQKVADFLGVSEPDEELVTLWVAAVLSDSLVKCLSFEARETPKQFAVKKQSRDVEIMLGYLTRLDKDRHGCPSIRTRIYQETAVSRTRVGAIGSLINRIQNKIKAAQKEEKHWKSLLVKANQL